MLYSFSSNSSKNSFGEYSRFSIKHPISDLNNKSDLNTFDLPFAVFISPKSNVGDTQDYKQVFTDIISDRLQEKYK